MTDGDTPIDPRPFLQDNYTPYEGDASFLAAGHRRARPALWAELTAMFPQERERGVYDVDPHTPALDHRPRPGLHRPGRAS